MGCCSSNNGVAPCTDKQGDRVMQRKETTGLNINVANFVTQRTEKVSENYKLGKILGEGSYGK